MGFVHGTQRRTPSGKYRLSMPSRHELEELTLLELAVRLGHVASHPEHHGEATAEKALKLRSEWAHLRILPSALSIKDKQDIEARSLTLQNRMVEFLLEIG
jgi:hypothetical protein